MKAKKIAVDNEKNIIVCGTFMGDFDFDFSYLIRANIRSSRYGGAVNVFIASYDSLLNYNWAFALDCAFSTFQTNMLVDNDGNIYVSHMAYNNTDFDPSEDTVYLQMPYTYGGFLAKYDKNGNFLWVKNYDYKLITILNNTLYGDNHRNIIKHDLDGNVIWEKGIIPHMELVFDNNSLFYTIHDNRDEYDHRLISLYTIDTSGNCQFSKYLVESTNSLFEFGKLFLVNNTLVINGVFWGNVDMDPGNMVSFINDTAMQAIHHQGEFQCWVPKHKSFMAGYSINGDFKFVKDYNDIIPSISILRSDSEGHIFSVGAFSESANVDFKAPNLNYLETNAKACYIAEYDPNFDFISAVKLTEIETSYPPEYYSLYDLYFDENVTIVGGKMNNLYLDNNFEFDPDVDLDHLDPYIAIYRDFGLSSSVIEPIEEEATNIKIYPNPTSGKLTIDIPRINTEISLSVININGQVLIRHKQTSNKVQLDISELTKGIYFVKIESEQISEVRKILKK